MPLFPRIETPVEAGLESVTEPPEAEHKSDCAVHNGPAYCYESCDCGALPTQTKEE